MADETSEEYLAALREDLKAYDNPEVFEDASLPQLYKLRIRTTHLPEVPYILSIEINGNDLPLALREGMFGMMRLGPDYEKNIAEEFGGDAEKMRAETLADEDYANAEQGMRRFFVRQFPKLMVHLYNITVAMSLASVIAQLMNHPSEQAEREKLLKGMIEGLLKALRRDIKQMLETRSSGRPVKVEKGPVPEIVRRVCLAGFGLMSGRTDKDAVPALKGVALALDMSEAALRKQLTRANYPWRLIKIHLETFDLKPPANSE